MALPLINPLIHFDIPGTTSPAVGYLFYTFAAGTTIFQSSYTDSTGNTPNPNPMQLDANGNINIWLSPGLSYKYIFTYPTDQDPVSHLPSNAIYTVDNIRGAASSSTQSVNANYIVTLSQSGATLLCNATAGNITITTPAALATFAFTVIKTDGTGNTVTIQSGGGAIGGTLVLTTQSQFITVVSDGNQWFCISSNSGLSQLIDSNESLVVRTVAGVSPVNYLSMGNAATGSQPIVSSVGTDTNIGLKLTTKGSGTLSLNSTKVQLTQDEPIVDSSGNNYLSFSKTSSAVNSLTVTNASSTNPPVLSSTGSDTNIGLKLSPKGTGGILANAPVSIVDPGSGFTSTLIPATLTGNRTITMPDISMNLLAASGVLGTASAFYSTTTSTTNQSTPFADPTTGIGLQVMSVTYTPTSTISVLSIDVFTTIGCANAVHGVAYFGIGLFSSGSGSTALAVSWAGNDALASGTAYVQYGGVPLKITYTMTSGTTSPLTFSVNMFGNGTGTTTTYFGGGNPYPFGSSSKHSGIIVKEYSQ